jgi:acyl-CoA thioesterase-2
VQPAAAGALSLDDVLTAVEASAGLTEVGRGLWQGPNVVLPGYRRLFGGQLLAQAIAVARTPGKVVRSLHLVFLAEGRPELPVTWSVEPLHDGRTFATRSVAALQGERLLATGLVSLHVRDVGGRLLEHSLAPPIVLAPSAVGALGQLGALAFETRPVLSPDPLRRGSPGEAGAGAGAGAGVGPGPDGGGAFWMVGGDLCVPTNHPERAGDSPRVGPGAAGPSEPTPAPAATLDGLGVGPPELAVWMRSPRAPRHADDQVAHQALLAYASDLTMMVAAMRPHAGVGYGSDVVEASAVTSHTISFHRPVRVDEWLLFVQESPAAAGGRAYIRGDVFDETGAVVASCAQEVLIRVRDAEGANPGAASSSKPVAVAVAVAEADADTDADLAGGGGR